MALKFTDDEIERAISNVYGKQNAGPNTVQSNQMFSDDEIDRAIRNVYGNVNQPQVKTAEANASAVSVNNDVVLPTQNAEKKAKMGLWDNVKGVAGAFGEALGEGVRDAAENFYSGAQYGSIATNQMADMEKRLRGIDITNPQRISDMMKESKQRAWIDSEYAQQVQKDIAERSQRQSQRMADIQEKYEDVPLADWAITGGQGVGNLLPSMAVGGLGGAGLGTAFFAANAYGGSLGEALNSGATLEQAGGYAAASAALETAVEAVFGGIPNLGGGMLDPEKLTKKYIKTAAGRLLANKLADITGEGIEEVASSIIEPFIRRAFYDKNAENASLGDMASAFGGGALVSAILGVYGFAGDYRRNKADIAEENAVRERATELKMDEKSAKKLTETFNEQTAGRFVEENLDADFVMHNGQYVMQKDGQITQVTKEMFDYAQRLKTESSKKTPVQREQAQTDVSKMENAENAAEMMQTQENVADMQQSADVQRAADNLQIVQELAQQGVAPQSDVEKLQSIVTGDNSPKADPKVVERENARVAAFEESARQGIASAEDVEKVRAAATENIRQSENKAFVTQKFGSEEISRIEELATEKGYKVVYEADDSEDAPNGYIKDDIIYINTAGNSPYFNVAVHEVLHGVKGNTAKWNSLEKSVFQLIGSDGDMTKFADAVVAKYTENPDSVYYKSLLTDGKLDGTKLNEEIVANFVEEYLPKIAGNDAQLMEKIKKDRNLIDGLLDIIRGIKNNLAIKFAKSEKAMLDEAERNLVNLLRAESREQGEDNARFSISDHIIGTSGKDYGKGVYLDSALLDGLSETEQKQMVRERVKELSGQTFTAYDSNGSSLDVRIARKNEKFRNKAGKLVTVNHDLDSKNTNDSMKRQAVILSDELIESASFNRTEKARYPHDWLDNNGLNDWDTWTVYLQEKNNSIWTADLKIANSKNGDKYLYDIVNIKMVDGGGKSPTTSTINNILQTGTNNNGKNVSGNNSQKRQRNSSSAGSSQGKFSQSVNTGSLAKKFSRNLSEQFGVSSMENRAEITKEINKILPGLKEKGFVTDAEKQKLYTLVYDSARIIENQEYKDLAKLIRTTGIKPLEGAEYVQFIKSYRGKVKFKHTGLAIDTFYRQLQKEYPEHFPDLYNEYDMMWRIGEVYDKIQITEKTYKQYYGENSENVKAEMYERFSHQVDVFGAKVNGAQHYENRVKELKEQWQKAQADKDKKYSVDDVKEAYRQLESIDEQLDKVQSLVPVDEKDKTTLDYLMSLNDKQEIDLAILNAEHLKEIYYLTKKKAQIKKIITIFNSQQREGKKENIRNLITTAARWKDKTTGIKYWTNTFERNIDDITSSAGVAKGIKDNLLKPVKQHVAQSTRFKNEIRDKIRKLNLDRTEKYDLSFTDKDGNTITGKFSEAALVQAYGEKLIDDTNLETIGADVNKIKSAAEEFSKIYEELYEKVNDVYITNGYQPLAHRKDYFPHFSENKPDSALAKMASFMGMDAVNMLPTQLAGRTEDFKPGRRYNANALQRQSQKTDYDAMLGMDRYLEVAADIIFLTEDIQNLRSFGDEIRLKFSKNSDVDLQEEMAVIDNSGLSEDVKKKLKEDLFEKGNYTKHLNNFVMYIDEYTNILCGKKSSLDRGMEKLMGRKMYTMMRNLESKVSANMVGANISSAITNVIPITQMAAEVKSKHIMHALTESWHNMVNDDGFMYRSDFLTSRIGSERLVDDSITKKISSKPLIGKIVDLMEIVDKFTSNVVVRGKYLQNIESGMDETNAMQNADEFAAALLADRSKGALPVIFESKNPLMKALTMFQVEQNNQLQYLMKDLPKNISNGEKDKIQELLWGFVKYCLGAYLYNTFAEFITGRKSAFSPIDILRDNQTRFTGWKINNILDETADVLKGEQFQIAERKGKEKTNTAIANTMISIAEELPFAAAPLAMSGLSDDAGRLPIGNAMPDLSNLLKLFDGETAREKKKTIVYKELSKPVFYLRLPVGGGQLKKTFEAGWQMAVNDGVSYYTSNKGEKNVQFVTDTSNPLKWAQSAAFGRWSTEEAREYVNNGFDYLSKSESQMYEYLKGIGIDSSKAYKQAAKAKAEADSDGNGYLKTEEVVRYLDKTGMSKQDKANLFSIMLPNVKNNPYK